MELFQLFSVFFQIGLFTFGGGLTMLPMLKYKLIEKRYWIEEEKLLDCYAIGQCTPGIIAVNTATYVGYLGKGVAGGVAATLGMASPSILIITLVAMFLQTFMGNPWIQHALMGIRGVVCALMLNTVLTMAKKSLVHPICYVICIVAFALALFTGVPTIGIIVLAAVAGNLLAKMGGQSA